MKLVCITGIDGTGKSTLARNTVAALAGRGVPATYIYGRTYPVLSRALMAAGRLLMLRGKDQWRDYGTYHTSKKQTMRNPLLAGCYTATILIDYYIQIWLKLLPHLFSNRTVVSDRYVYDTVISDLAVHLNYSVEQATAVVERALRLVPLPALTVLITIPAEVAFARKDDVPHIDYLTERQQFYVALKDRPEVLPLDGEATPEALVAAVVREMTARPHMAAEGA